MSMKVFQDLEVDVVCEGLDVDLFVGWEGSGQYPDCAPDNQLGSKIYDVYSLYAQLKRYRYLPFKVIGEGEDLEVSPLKTGHLFLPPPDTLFYESAQSFPVYLHPSVKTYVDTWNATRMTLEAFEKLGAENSQHAAEKVNDFAQELGRRFNQSSFQREVAALDKHCQKQFRQCVELYKSLAGKQEAVIIKRLDLWLLPQAVPFTEDQLLRMLSSLHQHRKDDVIKRIQGVVVKTQFSAFWGLGLNVTFFLEADTYLRGCDLAGYLGSFWRNVVCGGQGVYMDCDMHPNSFKRAGLGLHYFGDTMQEQQILSSLAYLTKVGRYLMAGNGVVTKLLA